MERKQLMEVYKLAHYLKLKPMTSAIAAFLACQVWMPLTKTAFEQLKSKLGVR
jgi:hypothetical protein